MTDCDNGLLPMSYVDSMPCDEDILKELGRVAWTAARLHAGVRDAINRHDGGSSDKPFKSTLGAAIAELDKRARKFDRADQIAWIEEIGRPVNHERNSVIHAVTYTARDGKQAIGVLGESGITRLQNSDLRNVTLALIHASMTLPG